jgi:hypothetical protein
MGAIGSSIVAEKWEYISGVDSFCQMSDNFLKVPLFFRGNSGKQY